jgi:hypothetical protein
VYPLGGISGRYKPIVPVHLVGPQVLPPLDAIVDSAADDTVFPVRLARRMGIDLTAAPQGEAQAIGQAPVPVQYARVTLLLTDGFESATWEAMVAFTPVLLRWPLLGQAGCLEFFDGELRGARREAIVTPNRSFPGQYVVHAQTPP